jgi:uncharacterized RDD family membrane protein YckC
MTAPTDGPDAPDEGQQPPAEPTPYEAPTTPPAAPPQPPTYGQYGAPESALPPAGQYGTPSPYGGQPAPPSQFGATPGAPFASWISRVGAYLLDALIIGVPAVVIILIGVSIGGGAGTAIAILGYLLALVFGLWNQVFRQGKTGQTIGKQIVGIKLIREQDGQPVGAGMAFLRGLAHVLDSIPCYIGFLWPLWDAKNQTFADKVCSTVVVTA